MGVDLRQVLAGILTLTMFLMLGHMIKRDHFDSVQEKFPGPTKEVTKVTTIRSLHKKGDAAWKNDVQELKQCWSKPEFDEGQQSKGYVTFSLTDGPEYHVSQIADAVVVARYLGATLVVPDIRGKKLGDKWNFGDIYDVEKFIGSLDGVVKVVKELPSEISPRKISAVKVPNRVSENYISEHVEKIYKKSGSIRLATFFPSVNMKKSTTSSNGDSVPCLAMFGTLKLQPEISEVIESMIERLKTLSRKSNGQFIAVDLRIEMLGENGCQEASGSKGCYTAQDIALFLRKIGFDKDATIYLTQPRWDNSLEDLKDLFPKTYTKESIMPADKKAKFLNAESSEYEKVIDFYVCSQSDIFVPAISGLFYSNVAGKRIALGKNQILVPATIQESTAPATKFISPYIKKKNHLAYSCFC
ncbi:protein MANNAN SYNTHESIS-RELATED 2-like [Cucurbita pepo subsp. pepo]|uniref:protein MANNAN SYNTHESIS-RELATED 2-like n=1 Tax=Cucurbita pepo subsp. pepo TaxID=3664 RepID=UPI000C9D8A9F|nr:protein MANNAN SYNTHESIS-RELATED 2-like [Cucurbita pepo subsp. pepo]